MLQADHHPEAAKTTADTRSRDPLPLPTFEAIVHKLLEDHPCRRPSVVEIARAAGRTPRELRAAYERLNQILGDRGAENKMMIRRMLTWSCLRYAALLIPQGTKVTAASRLAGFHDNGSFARQFRGYFGCSPHEYSGAGAQSTEERFQKSPRRGASTRRRQSSLSL